MIVDERMVTYIRSLEEMCIRDRLKGIGAGQQFLDATLRFSLSEFNTMEEIDYTLDTLYNICLLYTSISVEICKKIGYY